MLAVKVDDVTRTLQFARATGTLIASPGAEQWLSGISRLTGTFERFELGNVPWSVIEAAKPSLEQFWNSGNSATFPYQHCIYRADIDGAIGLLYFITTLPDGRRAFGNLSNSIMDGVMKYRAFGAMFSGRGDSFQLSEHDAYIYNDEVQLYASRLSFQMLQMLNLIIQTPNVNRTHVSPPPKVNAARAKNHKPLLPCVTHIDARSFAPTLQVTTAIHAGVGTHARPCEHLRRSHARAYKNQDGSVKKVIQIASMTINKGVGITIRRDHYEVRVS
jgi:hypothetical protein